jgi:hypothetical protein
MRGTKEGSRHFRMGSNGINANGINVRMII